MKLLIRNLSRTTTEKQIHTLFSTHGTITECTLVMDKVTGKSKGFGFVVMPDKDQALAALEAIHETMISKNRVRVKIAE